MSTKTLGILGGMGPQAGLRFCELLLELAVKNHGATANADYPHFLLNSLPVPDLITSRDDEEKTITMVEKGARDLRAAGANLLVMTCNTMHLFADRIERAGRIPFLSLIDAVVLKIAQDGRRRVGVLGSITTMRSGLYLDPLRKAGIEPIQPDIPDQELIVGAIQRVIARKSETGDPQLVSDVIEKLRDRGAQSVILGCTELPLIVHPEDQSLPVYDSISILAAVACAAIYEN